MLCMMSFHRRWNATWNIAVRFLFAIDRFSEQLTRYAGSRTRLKVKDGSIDDASG